MTKEKINDIEKEIDIRIANKVIRLQYVHKNTIELCRDYLVDDMNPDVVIGITEDELKSFAKTILHGELPTKQTVGNNVAITYCLLDIEPFVVHKKIADYLLHKDILLMHGSAIAVDNNCYIFTAPSGTGKTTHIMNWLKIIPDVVVVNGDKPLIDVKKKVVYGSPWCGKEKMNTNIAVTLAGIISLERGKENSIAPISFKEMLPVYLQQINMPEKQESVIKVFQLIGELKNIPCYRLLCNKEKESALVAYQELCGSL